MGVIERRGTISLLPTLLCLAWGCAASDIRDAAREGDPSQPGTSGPNAPGNNGKPSGSGTGETGSGSNNGSGSGSPSQGDPGSNTGTGDPGGSGTGSSSPPPVLPGQPTSNSTAPPPATSTCTDPNAPGPRQLRRLNAQEFAASIRDLFGDAEAPVTQVFNDPKLLGFTVDAPSLVVADLNADQLMSNAEAVAAWAVEKHLSKIASCNSHDANCGRTIVKNFGRKVFREPIEDNDSRIGAYVDKLFMAEENFTDGVTAVVTAMLQSPHFLYRKELGAGDSGAQELTPYEVATNLSYLMTGSTPDEALLSAADQVAKKSLTLTQMIDQQVERLLNANGEKAVMSFMTGWLGLDRLKITVKDASINLTDQLRTDMAGETRAFLMDAYTQNLPIGALFSADYSFINQALANHYGLPGAANGSDFQKVTYTAGQRDGGFLGQGGFLTGYARSDSSSPTQRGHMVRSRLLCQEVPPPPGGLDTAFKAQITANTTREKYLLEHASPERAQCYGCHELMDLIGISFEHYDTLGRYRNDENGFPIDATGTIARADGGSLKVEIDGLSGPKGLGKYLGESASVQQCVARYWAYFAYGKASWEQDRCTYDAIGAEAAKGNFSMKSILMGIVHAPHFTRRVQDQ